MKKFTLFLSLIALTCCNLLAQESQPWQLVDAQDLRIINKGFDDTQRKYARLPHWLQDSVRPTLWDRQECSAGIAVRFATNSKRIGVKYQLLTDAQMIHMAGTGIKGIDLYIWDPQANNYIADNKWMHVNCIRPYLNDKENKIVDKILVENLDGEMHEYMMYLPLYDGVEDMWVKVDSGAVITTGAPELIDPRGRIVAYGTSIMQGGCASRPGMCASNIISRETNREVINLGFSGEGKMDQCMARAMAQIPDVEIFVLDPVPNCTLNMCDSLTYDFVNILRKARPEAKIVMVEGPMYPYGRYDSYFNSYLPEKNAAFRANYEKLITDKPENLYYVTNENLDGVEDDGTVDGIHLTDLGFRHYANKLTPILLELLQKE